MIWRLDLCFFEGCTLIVNWYVVTIGIVVTVGNSRNNGVEEVRSLIDKVKYAPTQGQYKVYIIDDMNVKYAIKKRPILRVTDLTYENIRHISATKLIEVLERNFGGGWESLPPRGR